MTYKKNENKPHEKQHTHTLSSHERKFNPSAADTAEEIDAQENNNSAIDTDIERQYHGLNKKSLHSLKKHKPSSDEPESDDSLNHHPKGPSQ